MSGKITQIITKRSIKPKAQYSPSNPTTTTKHHLIIFDGTGNMMIVGNSSVKRLERDGTVKLNNGTTAKLIVSGTKDECVKRWSKQTHLSKKSNKINFFTLKSQSLYVSDNDNNEQLRNDDDDDDDDDHDDELPESMEQTLEMPGNTFSTPAPYRRRKTLVRRSSSPDSILSVSSPKRFVSNGRANYSTKYVNDDLPYLQSQSQSQAVEETDPTVMSSSDDEEIMTANNSVSFGRLFEEIKSTKANIRYVRTENHGIHQQLTSLIKKLSRFSSLVLSKNENDLDRYRDSNMKESYKSEIGILIHDGCDLLEVPARNPREYARNLLKLLFKPLELQTCLLPSQQSKRYSKSELDQERFNRLNGNERDAIRTRYRITKHHYTTFYKERIQETLAGCLYNEGTRKTKKQPIQQQQLHKENEIVHGNTTEVEDEIN
ncbi:unnamed protein product [Rotaria socialis]|uniref:Uncharacterized protein n=1 Tax=Rotaria socialis TaxID=392032 RepID=A0A817QU57_9BILA|nr:unnamed protein product [Rotaria socialis]